MKKVLLTLVSVLFVASTASAMPIALNPDAVAGLSGTYGQTGVFDQLGIRIQTTSTESGGAFTDAGDMVVQSLIANGPVDNAGMDSDWFFVGSWSNLTGVTSGSTFLYQTGTLELFVTETPYNFGSSMGVGDDTGFSGTKVAELSLVNGVGLLAPNPLSPGDYIGSVDLTWEFTELTTPGFWLDAEGNPLSLGDLSAGEKLFAIADANTDLVTLIPSNNGMTVLSDHNGSVMIGVVPEPATMVLFGTGLFGLAGAGLRKKFAA